MRATGPGYGRCAVIRRVAASLRRLFTLAAGVALGYALYHNGARWAYAYAGFFAAHHGLAADVLAFAAPVTIGAVVLLAAVLVRRRQEVSR